jgi:hypothetical protein
MAINIIIIYFSYIFLSFSVIGYGNLFSNLIFKKKLNYGFLGLLGIFILILYSYLSHFFYPHNALHNLIFMFLGFVSFFFNTKKNFFEILLTLLIFSILFISIIIFKTHDDFPYYHFGYSHYLTQSSLTIGIGMFNHGFRTPSAIFYLNSLFYLPLIKYYFFHLPAILILGYANIVFICNLKKNFKKNNINLVSYFILLSILFINIFFYRISEHGTDRSAQILLLVVVAELLAFILIGEIKNEKLSKIFLLIALIVSFKAFYVLYVVLLIPIILILKKKLEIKEFFLLLLKNRGLQLSSLMFVLILLTNFFNTGCLIYPVNQICFSNLDWSIPNSEIIRMKEWYQQWSKAGAGPDFRVDNPEIYIQSFNWVGHWIDEYFFNKVSDFLLSIITLMLIVGLTFHTKKKITSRINNNILLLLLFLVMLFFEWFYNHPSLRYGGYTLIASIFFIIASIKFESFVIDKNKIKKKFIYLVAFSFLIFFCRNAVRINNEIVQYNFNPLKNFSFRVTNHHYRIENRINEYIQNYKNCKLRKNNCKKDMLPKIEKVFNIYKFNIK